MKILITYASITGNTEKVARFLYRYAKQKLAQDQVVLADMTELSPDKLAQYQLIVMGCSTWMDGDMNDVGLNFFDQLEATDVDLQNTQLALFGLGDKRYHTYCTAVEIMAQKLKHKNAVVSSNYLKIDGTPDEKVLSDTQNWLDQIVKELR